MLPDLAPTSTDAVPGHGEREDITTPTHVHDLVIHFYREVVFDGDLEPVFGEVAEVDWAEHIPKLIDYWCWILLGKGHPSGSIMGVHDHVHQIEPIQRLHCDLWFKLWTDSVDARWQGPTATKAKDHAATLMTGLAKHVFGFVWERPEQADPT